MTSIKKNTTLKQWQSFVRDVYGLSNDRRFSNWDMLSNIERFVMRGLKGIRKSDAEKIKLNLIISFSWFSSLLTQLHIDLEEEIWSRFPSVCSYCKTSPCRCKKEKTEAGEKINNEESCRPETLSDFQEMFGRIYPTENRTLEHAGIHLAEEVGEFSEAFMTYRGSHSEEDFEKIKLEAADVFSCMAGVFNSLKVDLADELAKEFYDNCHECHKSPCECNFSKIINYKS